MKYNETCNNYRKIISVGGGGVWAMAGVQGKVAFGLSLFVY